MALIRKKEQQEINRLRKNYLAKRRRQIKKGVPEDMLPNFPIIRPNMTRVMVNTIKEQMKRFATASQYKYVKVNENLTLTKKQINDLKNAQRRANRLAQKAYQRNLKAEFIPLSERGWAYPGAHRTVESEHMKVKPKGYTKTPESFTSMKMYENYMEHLQTYLERGIEWYDERYKANTIKAIENVFGKTNAAELVERIKSIPTDEFVFLMETQDLEIEYIYLDDVSGWDEKLTEIEAYFDDKARQRYQNYIRGK